TLRSPRCRQRHRRPRPLRLRLVARGGTRLGRHHNLRAHRRRRPGAARLRADRGAQRATVDAAVGLRGPQPRRRLPHPGADGGGVGITFVPATLPAVSGVSEKHSGLVSGVSTTAIQIGGAIGLAVLATIAATTTRNQAAGTATADALSAGYTRAFQVGAVIIA